MALATTTRMLGAMHLIPWHAPTRATLAMAMIPSRRKHGAVAVADVVDAATSSVGEGRDGRVKFLGGGIAGLATARYLLQNAQSARRRLDNGHR
jgi:hypothetical protein